MKRTRSIILIAILLLSTMVVFVTPAVAQADNSQLWVVPENPTMWHGPDPDNLLTDTVIQNVIMGTTFSGNVLVLNHAPTNTANVAENVWITFFIYDDSNIDNITVGTAKRIEPGNPTTDPNTNSSLNVETLIFSPVSANPPVPAGFDVNYSIGDIPWHGNQNDVGDPEVDLNAFNPDNATVYIEVPFTINFISPPAQGFMLYAYAGSPDNKQIKTVWSHDCGFYNVPEFATIAIPIVALLGLFAFYRRKQKK